jgi:hypothetical protein
MGPPYYGVKPIPGIQEILLFYAYTDHQKYLTSTNKKEIILKWQRYRIQYT